jgi:hypothetical protein
MKFIILLIVICIFLIVYFKFNVDNFIVNPCTDYLSAKDYLVHMIPHHQVAIDMCNLMMPISKSKSMQHIYRTIIWNQKIEILFYETSIK